ncbi:MAG: acetylglutamate kinase [Cyclobacteriaceae bacterium]|nr:acetylglutamate kinase [Cyclobacteriaceae bacterium]
MAKIQLRVFKIGGKVVEDEPQLSAFLESFAKLKGNKILVHGGGKWVSEMSQRLGIEVKMIDGRRITDADTLEVVKMMLAGVANKNIVSKLQGHKCNAIGLTGADGNTIRADKRPLKDGIDYGFVGDVKKVNDEVILNLISAGLTPVFAAMTHDGLGNLFNTNADTIASSVAVGMSGDFDVELNYCFELNGVLKDINDPLSVIHEINQNNYATLKEDGIINSGMIPKIDNAFDALNSGVKAVRIMNSDHIVYLAEGKGSIGTLILK